MRFVKECLENAFISSLVFWKLNRVQLFCYRFLTKKIIPASEYIIFGDSDVVCYLCSFSYVKSKETLAVSTDSSGGKEYFWSEN